MEENRSWRARWIWHERYPWTNAPGEHELVLFRRTFEVEDAASARLVLSVSADSRYRLFLNSESVSVGPCKGDQFTHYYETVDLTGKLREGTNVLAAKVLHLAASDPHMMGLSGPIAIHRSNAGVFLLEGTLQDGEREVVLDTGAKGSGDGGGNGNESGNRSGWLAKLQGGYTMKPSWVIPWLGGLEDVDGAGLDHGWEQPEYAAVSEADGWKEAVVAMETRGGFGELTPWQLAPRPIPPLFERERPFAGVTKSGGDVGADALAGAVGTGGGAAVVLQPGQSFWAELDAGELATGYLRLAMRGGAGSRVSILCAECYEDPSSTIRDRVKGVRDDAENGILLGDTDLYRVAGAGNAAQAEVFEPFWFRTFRYVRLEITAGEEPLELASFGYRDTGYPLDVKAEFSCSDPGYEALWQLSLNTLQRCMHETYEDCPYYEQLQYTMDTRLQMMFTYMISGDDRMARRTLYDYHSSALPSGMLQSRYPSQYPQIIPSFSLYWIHMLYDHYMYFGDAELVRYYRRTIGGVLDWFRRLVREDGLVGETPEAYWPYYDWVESWENGAPDARLHGPVTLLSQMYAAALNTAAKLYDAVNWRDAASEARAEAGAVNAAVREHCWRVERGLFSDGPGVDMFSQHAQLWAVVSGAVEGAEAEVLLERTLGDATLPVVSVPMSYTLFRTLSDIGRYDLAQPIMQQWNEFLELHLTTLPEWAFGSPRSDCHAWSALPLSEFTSEILGVKSGRAGYAEIRIAPQPLRLTWARGKVATPHGLVEVSWSLAEDGSFQLQGEGPAGIPLVLTLPSGEVIELPEGGQFGAV
ncbi:alpha-L-rhamnosidase-like protein [Paenibacillus taihuensis]|uniref:Alpha-L-rhamnosidase-like protein n=1 Tax=Paenibacillus taihuensis TaxID=1156355 RepID=A0A3D9S1B9_9BACL|nr:alpha-L-rhamnosidase C-terminal domain-containing protein [Paenibacillus taihuensis]REE86407.1 alpha-L-rhamnosidase-like protein [Paenibacillus taihuensis]